MDPMSRVHGTIVVTTESRAILDLAIAAKNYTGFPFKVIANDQDVAQDTGNVGTIKNNNAGDDVMYSTFTSIQMQLMTGDTIGICCSNFHKLISIFLGNGYGEGSFNNFECLQENENPAYRVCCKWTNTQVSIIPSGNKHLMNTRYQQM
ncbi:hypothetical protein ACHAXA_011009 [Cyclostephanos tholiformis]|uniref:Uncharacterized protein n=1 Tax=Cyclostephanos tholiformis TaxID=382380 RepID=A0ABD3RHW5_9STRA